MTSSITVLKLKVNLHACSIVNSNGKDANELNFIFFFKGLMHNTRNKILLVGLYR